MGNHQTDFYVVGAESSLRLSYSFRAALSILH